ncbi:hypothetical protein GCM10011519_02250 [Marmoricola endophyticus]|uniref:Gram-positive cocci surface proteins LPxTG domain-containing protein n=1 Tax=Marmoricola endophyticus TaxID=2040280 RepID=A0A917B9S0_9ACTN|nr:hypothetical protein GCM10011519_02250 [Marmoricola endophyticus]
MLGAALGLSVVAAVLAIGTPSRAAAAESCPRPDKASNVIQLRPGQSTITFPGARSADFCAGRPAYAKTELWPGAKPVADRQVDARGVGTWTRLDDGRITFTVDPSFQRRPLGDDGPGRDAILKFAIVDTEGNYVASHVLAYVVYDGASAFPDSLKACARGGVVRPLANDVAGWRGTNEYDKRHARLLPGTLRLADTGPGGVVRTDQGAWHVLKGGEVRFTPAEGWHGKTPPLRYSVRDTFGNTASSTVTATSCGATSASASASASPTSSDEASSASTADDEPASKGIGTRAWVPLVLALLCVLAGGLALRRRRSSDGGGQ